MEERARQAKLEKGNKRLSFMCYMLSVAILGLGVAVLSNYKMLDKIRVEVENNIIAKGIQPSSGEIDMAEFREIPKTEEEMAKQDSVLSGRSVIPKYYIVQNGDTLSSISFKMYNSVGYVADIMRANELEEMDEIREGDRILIPTVE